MSEDERVMVERSLVDEVAAEMCREDVEQDGFFEWDNCGEKDRWRHLARTALRTMRDPTPEMVRRGYEAADDDIGGDWVGRVEIQSCIGKTVWRRMIDAALSGAGQECDG